MANPSDTTTIIFLRHAQTLWNKEHRYAGDSEVPLAPEAKAQIQQITRRIAREPIEAIYASPLSRCQITAQEIADYFNLPIFPREDLKERNLGEWEGKTPAELPPHHTGYHFPESAYDGNFTIENAEPLEHLERRVRHFIAQMHTQHHGQTILAATHAGVIWAVQKYIVSNPPKKILWPGNCTVCIISCADNHITLNQVEPGL